MPQGTSPPPAAGTRGHAVEVLAYDQYVDRQLGRVSNQVRTGEFVAGMLELAVMTLAGIAAVVLLDHWVWDPGVWGRWALLLLLAAVVGTALWRVIPRLWRTINPAYAARIVEDTQPSFKNALLNLVFLRRTPSRTSDVVMQELEARTAKALTGVALEGVVDRSRLILWLGLLAALIVLSLGYAVVSPKSVGTSLRRLFLPWSPIARPSRVLISQVEPGHATAYEGQNVTVRASIARLGDNERVWLVFSSSDQRFVDERLAMQPAASGTYESTLPPEPEVLTSDLVYRVEAGDAVAGPFRLRVVPVPSAAVERLRLEFPAYTSLAAEEIEREGDIEAIEGTLATVIAKTNQDAREAFLEFDPADELPKDAKPSPEPIPMSVDGRTIQGTFPLLLQTDRATPQYARYQVRFRSDAGELNPNPPQYHIRVTRDLSPVVEVLSPTTRDIELAENTSLPIEVRALDPDFQLQALDLKGIGEGREVLNQPLIESATAGQVTKQWELRPDRLGLSAGDTLLFWAEARDNRTDPVSGDPAPNVESTIQYRLRVKEPATNRNRERPAKDPSDTSDRKDKPDPSDSTDPSDPSQQSEGNQAPKGSDSSGEAAPSGNHEGQSGEADNQDPSKDSSGESDKHSSQQPSGSDDASSQQNNKGSNDGPPKDNGQGSGSAQKKPEDKNEGQAESNRQDPSNDKGQGKPDDNRQDPSNDKGQGKPESNRQDPSNDKGQGKPDDNRQDPSDGMGQGKPDDNRQNPSDVKRQDRPGDKSEHPSDPTGAGQSGANHEGESDRGNPGQPSTGGEKQPGDKKLSQSEDRDPLPGDGSRDGDAFERILDAIRDKSKKDASETPPPDSREQPPGDGQQQPESGSSRSDSRAPAPQPAPGTEPQSQNSQPSPPDVPRDSNESSETRKGQQLEPPSDKDHREGQNETQQDARQPGSSQGDRDQSKSSGEKPGQKKPGNAGEEGPGMAGTQGESQRPGEQGPEKTGDQGKPTIGQGKQGEPKPTPSAEPGEEPGTQGEEGPRPGDGSRGTQSRPGARSQPKPGADGRSADRGQAESKQGGAPTGIPQGGTEGPRDAVDLPPDPAGPEPPVEDPANLDYARKATDMVLDYLKDRRRSSDPELLKQLGWTKAEMDQFIQRWQDLRAAAQQPDASGKKAQQTLDDWLRGLGLQRPDNQLRRDRVREHSGHVQDAGATASPPPEYEQQYRAYLRSRQLAPDDRDSR